MIFLSFLALIFTFNVWSQTSLKIETLISRDEVVWGIDFLPESKIIFTEKNGKLFVWGSQTKKLAEIMGTPKVYSKGQGGLLDVRVDPDFKNNNFIYLSYSEPVGDKSTTAMSRYKLKDNKLTDEKKFFSGNSPNENDIHYGSRIEFDLKGHIFISMGDRGDRPGVQDLSHHQGKIMRFNMDGSIPQDNPFVKTKNALPEIFTLGHRNPQGLTRHPETGEIWESEMGPKGGDEVNIIKAGNNYGWPEVSYGTEYHGPEIGPGTKPGVTNPLVYWVPSISPSGITFYSGDKFPQWKNDLFLGNLSGTHLRRLDIQESEVKDQEVLLKELGLRWRTVRTGPDGYLYFGTDDGKIGRVVKK